MLHSHRLSQFSAIAALASLMLAASPVSAWDGAVVGNISTLDVAAGSNYGFRVSLNGVANMCTGGPNWAFLNDTDSNYKTYVATFLLAKAQGNKVLVYSNLEGAYCHIGYISIQPS